MTVDDALIDLRAKKVTAVEANAARIFADQASDEAQVVAVNAKASQDKAHQDLLDSKAALIAAIEAEAAEANP